MNPTGKKHLENALIGGDLAPFEELAVSQADAGADLLDVNIGIPDIDAPATMAAAVKAVQAVTALPIVIDSADPSVLEAALRIYNGKPIVNSLRENQKASGAYCRLLRSMGRP